jgi:branched-chain amino acid transport system substrate-binding protein
MKNLGHLVVLIALFSLLSCGNSEKTTVAIMTKLESGSIVGSSEINAARLFLEEHRTKNIEIFPVDDAWEPKKTKLAYEEVRRRGIRILITSHVSTCALAIRDEINRDHVITFVTGATTDLLSGKNDYIFRNIQDVRYEQISIAEYINGLSRKKLLVIRDTDNDGYTVPALKYLQANLKRQAPVIDISINRLDLDALAGKMKRHNFDVLYLLIGGYKSVSGSIAQLAKKLRPDTVIIYTPWMKTPSLLETAGKTIKDSIVPSHYPPRAETPAINDYVERFKKRFGYSPTFISLNVYSALQIVSEALAMGKRSPEEMRDYILNKRTFKTDLGDITFDEYGDTRMPLYFITDLSKEF